jgi:multidrug efflux pump subunit AcrA (membrane-fusion protein)
VGDAAFAGKVSFIAPMVDAATRTVKVRMQIPNPDTKLKLEMWATARLKVNLGERLAIPAPAVLRTGEHSYALKDDGSGRLTPVEIKIGPRSGDWFALLAGLEAGDRVVTSANFLVDSESQLKAALAGMSPP